MHRSVRPRFHTAAQSWRPHLIHLRPPTLDLVLEVPKLVFGSEIRGDWPVCAGVGAYHLIPARESSARFSYEAAGPMRTRAPPGWATSTGSEHLALCKGKQLKLPSSKAQGATCCGLCRSMGVSGLELQEERQKTGASRVAWAGAPWQQSMTNWKKRGSEVFQEILPVTGWGGRARSKGPCAVV